MGIPGHAPTYATSSATAGSIPGHSSHAGLTVVPVTSVDGCGFPQAPPMLSRFALKSGRGAHPLLVDVRLWLVAWCIAADAVLSDSAQQLLAAAWAPRTQKLYKYARDWWSSWCVGWDVDSASAPVFIIVLFLMDLFD